MIRKYNNFHFIRTSEFAHDYWLYAMIIGFLYLKNDYSVIILPFPVRILCSAALCFYLQTCTKPPRENLALVPTASSAKILGIPLNCRSMSDEHIYSWYVWLCGRTHPDIFLCMLRCPESGSFHLLRSIIDASCLWGCGARLLSQNCRRIYSGETRNTPSRALPKAS